MSSAMTLVNHDQNLTTVMGGLNAPTAEDGVLRVDMVSMNGAPNTLVSAATPTDGDVTDWSVSVWGRTIPSRFTAPIGRTY
jgi:hypothetical protein